MKPTGKRVLPPWRPLLLRLLILPALAGGLYALFDRFGYLPMPKAVSLSYIGNWLMLIVSVSGLALLALSGPRAVIRRAIGFLLFLSPLWLIPEIRQGTVVGLDKARLLFMLFLCPLSLWGAVTVRAPRRALPAILTLCALLLARMALPYLLKIGHFSAFSDITLMLCAFIVGWITDAVLYAPRFWALAPIAASAIATALYAMGGAAFAWAALCAGIIPIAIQLKQTPARKNAWAHIAADISALALTAVFLYMDMPA